MEEEREIGMYIFDKFLVVTVQCELDDRLAVDLRKKILEKAKDSRAKGVILDVSCVKVMDAYLFQSIKNTAEMIGLMGIKMVLSGIRPEVACSLSDLGYYAGSVLTAVNIEHGQKILEQEDTFLHGK